jgi:predicted nucleic acid-binding protein
VEEDGSEDVERAVASSDRIATSAAAYPEARAAFARLEREDEISPEQHGAAVADLDADWPSFGVADLTRTFARFCGRTAARFGLRGYDAVHLASAVSVGLAAQLKHEENLRRGVAGTRIEAVHFYTYDERLERAARRVLHVYETGG